MQLSARPYIQAFAILLALAACTTTDDRPQTLSYITETILAPNCATAECHSDLHKQNGYVFDTVAHAQDSLVGATGTLKQLVVPGDPMNSYLISVLNGQGGYPPDPDVRSLMPLDHPLSNKDIFLIGQWIENGAYGFVAP